MKLWTLLSLALLITSSALAQDEPADPDPAGAAQAEVDPEVREKLSQVLAVTPTLLPGNVVQVVYPCAEVSELEDFEGRGFDKVDLAEVFGGGGKKEVGMELGAGSRNVGTLMHDLAFLGAGALELEVEAWVAHNTPSAVLCFLLSKKVGIAWGQTAVKPKSMRPYGKGAAPDKTLFREERTVKFSVTWKDDVLTVKCNGKTTDQRRFTKGELKSIRFGVLARNVRVVLSNVVIKGELDTKQLAKLKPR